jgi:hypothetical protein
VEGDIPGGARGVLQHHSGDGEDVPLQEARLWDLLCSQLDKPPAIRGPSISGTGQPPAA